MISSAKNWSSLLAVMFLHLTLEFNEASLSNAKTKPQNQNKYERKRDHSSNPVFINNEGKEDLSAYYTQHYHLPEQTEFFTTRVLPSTGFLLTSPPNLNIHAAPVQIIENPSSNHILHVPFSSRVKVDDSANLHLKHKECVSETILFDLVRSPFLLPSETFRESMIMSGRIEIASKTSSETDVPKEPDVISRPSIILQGTQVNIQSVTDM